MAHSVRVGMVAGTGAAGRMVSESVALLLPGLGSDVEEAMVTVLASEPEAVEDRCTAIRKLPDAPEARDGVLQLIVPFVPTAGVVQFQPGDALMLTKVEATEWM
jgi:hypothetical protein